MASQHNDETGEIILGCTDIDLIIDGIYYQVKRSSKAFKYGAEGVDSWVAKVWHKFPGVKIEYVTPSEAAVPLAAWERIINHYKLSIKEVSFL